MITGNLALKTLNEKVFTEFETFSAIRLQWIMVNDGSDERITNVEHRLERKFERTLNNGCK